MRIVCFLLLVIFQFCALANNLKSKPLVMTPSTMDQMMLYLPSSSFDYAQLDHANPNSKTEGKIVSTNSFYASPVEVTNGMYLEFVRSMIADGKRLMYEFMPDTLVWRDPFFFNEPYVEYYLRHPAYRDYPVVGLTLKKCEMYCDWLTLQYNSLEKRAHKKVKFRLPTSVEWYRMASSNSYADIKPKKSDTIQSSVITMPMLFPWGGPFLENAEGQKLAKYTSIYEAELVKNSDTLIDESSQKYITATYSTCRGGEYSVREMGIAGHLNELSDITAPVKSYWATGTGFYNLAGNVEEFVAEYGISKGGSWQDVAFYLRNDVYETYDATNEASSSRGFRFVMDVIEEW